MEVSFSVIILIILLVVALVYIGYIQYKKQKEDPYQEYRPMYQEKHVRFEDERKDTMSFLEPNYEQRRLEEMRQDLM